MSSPMMDAVASVILGKENMRPVAAPVRTGMKQPPRKFLVMSKGVSGGVGAGQVLFFHSNNDNP